MLKILHVKYYLLFILIIVLNIRTNAVTKTVSSGTTWQTAVWSPAGIPTSSDDVFISASTFTVNGAAVCGSLTLNSTAATTVTITGSLVISGTTGNLDINPADNRKRYTINVGSNSLSIAGQILNPANGTSRINIGAGGVCSVGGLLTLQTKDNIVITGNGILNCNGGLVDGNGAITLSNTCKINVAVKYEVRNASVTWVAGSTIAFAGNTNVISSGALTINFSNVELNSGTTTLLWPIRVSGNWTNNGGTLSAGANTVSFSGAAGVISGVGSTSFGPLSILSGAVCSMNNNNTATTLSFVSGGTASSLTHANGTVFSVSGAVTLNQPTGAVIQNWNINNATVSVGGLINFSGANATTTLISRITINDGILNANGGITFVTAAAATKQIVMSGGTVGIINLRGALIVPAGSATLTAGASSTFNYCDAVSAQTVNCFSAGAYNNLTFNNTSAGGAVLSAAITTANVTGNLSVQTGTLCNGTFAIVGNAAKIFSVSDGATFRLTGASAMPTGFGTTTLGVTSTCDFNGALAQTIAAHNYGNLTSSNIGARTLVSLGIIGVANVYTPGTNVFTTTGSTIDFNGTGAQTIPVFTYNNLTTSIGGTKTLGGAITVNNDLTISSPSTLDVSSSNYLINIKRDWINNGTFNRQLGTVAFNGSAAQAISGTTTNVFYNISILPTIAGVNVSANNAVNVINDLTFDATPGSLTFTTNGNVTLKSSSGQTARVAAITNPTGLTIAGNLNIERFAPGGTTGWTLMGNPGITGMTFSSWDDDTYITCAGCPDGYNLGGTNFCSIQRYSETAGGLFDDYLRYSEIASISNPITIGEGFWVYFGNGEFTTTSIMLDVTGAIVKGDLSIPLTVTGGASDDHGWNLLANPYPSPISWDLIRNGNPNVDAEIQVYNPDFGAHSSYAGGVGTNGLSNTGAIPMGQGFYVHATAATTLNFSESVKSNTQSPLLRLNGINQTANLNIAQTVVRLKVSGGPYSMRDETVLHFNTNATNAWDSEWDAHKLAGYDYYSPSISSLINNIDYSINALPALSGTTVVPILVKTGAVGTYTLSASELINVPSGACVQLTDILTGNTHDLKNSGYVCTLSDTATVPRFLLTVTLNNNLSVNTSVIQNTCSGNGLITAIGNDAGPWNYYWKNASGNIIKTSLNKSVADSITQLNEGVYSVEVSTVGACNSASQNFTINASVLPVADFASSVSEIVTLVNGIATVDFTNNSLNSDTYAWSFGDGNTSNLISPQHNFVSEGNYEVELVASNAGCSEQVSVVKNITVVPESLQIISNKNDLSCVNKNEGKIIASGNNSGPWDYIWLDGANTIVRAVYAKANPDTLDNLAAGIYTLRMRTMGAVNYTEETFCIASPVSPLPAFSVDNDTLDLNLGAGVVTFTNSSANADSYSWDFGDLNYSQLINPSHTYTVGGVYVVTMYAYNAACGDSVASYELIEVLDAVVGLKDAKADSDVLVGQNSAGEVFVKFKYENQTSLTISVYNTLGAKIMQDVSLNATNEIVSLNVPEVNEQLLLVEVKAEGRESVVNKIIKRK